MNDMHTDYLKDEHLEQQQESNFNTQAQKTYLKEAETPDQQLEAIIMEIVINSEKQEDTISADLEHKLMNVISQIGGQNEEEIVRLRMNELALSKILVYTHGKSEFRLVTAHHHMGTAYLAYKCYEQSIDHLTLALKKNSKLSSQIKQTKLYHSMVLTTLSRCYYEIASYDDSLQVLSRALEIQNAMYKELNQSDRCYIATYRLTAHCYLKLKNYKKAHEYIRTAAEYCQAMNGQKSPSLVKIKVDIAKIYFQEKNYDTAIEELDTAIQVLLDINYPDKHELIQLEDILAMYYEKNGQQDKQIETYYARLQLLQEMHEKEHKNVLKFKRTIASTLIKYQRNKEAIAVLEEILEAEEKVYGPGSLHVGKTLKMLGLVYMANQETNSAEHYLKRAQKILHEQGNSKLVKEIKGKLMVLKETREKKINGMA